MTEDVTADAESPVTAAPDSPLAMDPEMSRHPQPTYKLMRDLEPIFRVEPAGVIVTKHADIEQIFKTPEIFSSAMSAAPLGNIRPLIPLQIDLPEHRMYRKILQPLFSPQRMNALHDPVTALVNELIDKFVERRRDRLLDAVLGAVPVAGLPDVARASDGGTAPLPRHEGRHHQAAGRRGQTDRTPRRRGLSAQDRRLDLRVLRRRAGRAQAAAQGRHPEPVPGDGGGGRSPDPRGDRRHLLPVPDRRAGHGFGLARLLFPLPRRGTRSAPVGWSPSPAWFRGRSRSCCAGRRR